MTTDSDIGGISLSPEENAFFESGGNSAIPSDTGSASAGNGSDGSGSSTGADKGGDQGGDQGNKGGTKEPSTVPLAALHEERNRRKASDTEIKALREKVANFEGKFSVLERLNKPAGEPEQPAGPPSVEDDIFGAVKHVGETVAQMQQRLDAADAASKAEGERTTFVNNYRSDVDKFKATTPDFMDGYNFLLNSRAAELVAIGYDNPADPSLTPAEQQAAAKALHDAVVADEYAIADLAFKKNKSPAEIIYGLAKQRGYAVKAPAADTGKGAAKLETIERGQQANKSLSNTGGSSGDPDMTAQQLIAMPADEFEAWCNKNPAKAKRLMGG